MTPEEYVELLRFDGDVIARVAADGLDRDVPSCPGWTVADLLAHLGAIYQRRAAAVRAGGTREPPRMEVEVPPREVLIGWYLQSLHDIADVLQHTDPDEPAWSWAGDHRAGFWQRRMAHETAIHRWDAQAALGAQSEIAPPPFAADGVSEVFEVRLLRQEQPYKGPAGSIILTARDTGDEWTLEVDPPEVRLGGGHGRAHAMVQGSASDLDLVLWKRLPANAVQVLGRPAVFDGFLGWIDHS